CNGRVTSLDARRWAVARHDWHRGGGRGEGPLGGDVIPAVGDATGTVDEQGDQEEPANQEVVGPGHDAAAVGDQGARHPGRRALAVGTFGPRGSGRGAPAGPTIE